MVDIVGATTSLIESAESGVKSIMDSGPASGLSGIADSISGAIGSVGSFLGTLGSGAQKIKLPSPNVLSSYASYDYILTLSAMSVKDVNFPDSTYKAGKALPIICKSAGSDPTNRVKTAYGKFDFFMDNLKFETVIGPHNAKSTNVTTIQFDIIEPYSLGVFILALQTASYNAGFKNWRDAPFLLTIEFRGSKENGLPQNIPSVRHIPIKFTTIGFRANEQGSKYSASAFAIQNQALTVQHASLKSDTTIKGTTVQELLQTGEQSLQAVVNAKLKELVTNKQVAVADEVIIMFPKDVSSAPAATSSNQTGSSATINPTLQTAASIFSALGVIKSTSNKTFIQAEDQLNELGKASMGYDLSNKGDASSPDETTVYNEKTGIWTRGNLTGNVNEGTMRFAQDVDIPTVINQVLLMSQYPATALDNTKEDNNGMKTWWRVDTQVFYIETDDNLAKTGTMPRVIVYRIVPYLVHSSKLSSPNTPVKGYEPIKKRVVKAYNYVYTGKNSEVIKFDIDYSVNFSNVLAADAYKNNIDVNRASAEGVQAEKQKEVNPMTTGYKPSNVPGSTTSQVKYSGTTTAFDNKGGGGTENEINRAARVWHDAITNPNDMVNLNLEICGDPFWIANSGQGNYTAKSIRGIKDLTVDGSVDWQTSEVDITVSFRSPFDINQTSGLYNFGTTKQMAPVMGLTGLYCINTVTNHFRGGVFRQNLKGFRRPMQESKATPKPSGVSSNEPPPATQTPVAGGDRGTRGGA